MRNGPRMGPVLVRGVCGCVAGAVGSRPTSRTGFYLTLTPAEP